MANCYYSRRLMAPIILITIGVLFLLDELGDWGFSRTWPIILIVIGAVKIFERFLAPTSPTIMPPAGGPGTNTTWQGPSAPGSTSPGGSPKTGAGGTEPPKSL